MPSRNRSLERRNRHESVRYCNQYHDPDAPRGYYKMPEKRQSVPRQRSYTNAPAPPECGQANEVSHRCQHLAKSEITDAVLRRSTASLAARSSCDN